MKVTIRTEWPEVVKQCLYEMDLGSSVSAVDGSILIVNFFDDFTYRDVAAWLAAGLAFGIILQGGIER